MDGLHEWITYSKQQRIKATTKQTTGAPTETKPQKTGNEVMCLREQENFQQI